MAGRRWASCWAAGDHSYPGVTIAMGKASIPKLLRKLRAARKDHKTSRVEKLTRMGKLMWKIAKRARAERERTQQASTRMSKLLDKLAEARARDNSDSDVGDLIGRIVRCARQESRAATAAAPGPAAAAAPAPVAPPATPPPRQGTDEWSAADKARAATAQRLRELLWRDLEQVGIEHVLRT